MGICEIHVSTAWLWAMTTFDFSLAAGHVCFFDSTVLVRHYTLLVNGTSRAGFFWFWILWAFPRGHRDTPFGASVSIWVIVFLADDCELLLAGILGLILRGVKRDGKKITRPSSTLGILYCNASLRVH